MLIEKIMNIRIIDGATFKKNEKQDFAEYFKAGSTIYDVDSKGKDLLDKMRVRYEILKDDAIKQKALTSNSKNKKDKTEKEIIYK